MAQILKRALSQSSISITEHFIEKLKLRFPRLQEVTFSQSDKDEYTVEDTPAGTVETVYLYERADFEKAVIALAYKLEPRPIPPSMGAIFLNGLLDHISMEKVALIILSRGGYSGITSDMLKRSGIKLSRKSMGIPADEISEEKWEELSLIIRKNHELAHYVQRKLFPENKDVLRDEIKADMVGIIEAFGVYDGFLARMFLGIEGDTYRKGARLENYISQPDELTALSIAAEAYISSLERRFSIRYKNGAGFDILIEVETEEKLQKRMN